MAMRKVETDLDRKVRMAEIKAQQEEEAAAHEEKKKNHNFVQLYREAMPELRWLMNKSGIASSILFFILEHMDHKNALVCPHSVFMDRFEVSRTTVYRAINLLVDNGFLDKLKTGNTNMYIVNTEVAWSSWANQKEFAKFDGNVLVSKKDNKDYEYRSQAEKFKALRERENLK